ncbi:MAG: hypothetical protein JNM43_23435 [Planctomycetaceae bacterium]|nr:hypothetical protein [Planctomycetaceae bacterium]
MTMYCVGSEAQGIPGLNQGDTIVPLPASMQRWPSGQELLDAKLIAPPTVDGSANSVGVTLSDSHERISALLAASTQVASQSKIVVSGPLVPAGLWEKIPTSLRPFLVRLTPNDLVETNVSHLLAQQDLRLSEVILTTSPEVISTDAALSVDRLSEVGPGKSSLRFAPLSKALRSVLKTLGLTDYGQKCVEAGMLLHHDFLDESHRVSQTLEGVGNPVTADYWHGIMHRREPDAGNASYWFRRVGSHPALRTLGENLLDWLQELKTDRPILQLAESTLTKRQAVDPYRLIELSQSALKNRGSETDLAVKLIQSLEVMNLLTFSLDNDRGTR